MRPLPPGPGQLRASDDGGARRPAAPAETSGSMSWIAEARRPGRGCCVVRGRSAHRLAGERALATGQFHRRLIGVGHAGLGPTAPRGRAPAPAPPNRRRGCLHLETWRLHVGTVEVSRSIHQISKYRHRCLYLETACRSHKCSPTQSRFSRIHRAFRGSGRHSLGVKLSTCRMNNPFERRTKHVYRFST